jgi:hypothetical protein
MREAPEPPPSARFESPFAEPENPQAVRQELFGSLLNQRSGITPNPRTYKFGNSLVSVDPRSGATEEIFNAPQKPDTRGASFDKQVILGEIAALRRLQNNPMDLKMSGRTPEQIKAQIAALNERGRNLFAEQPAMATPTPATARPQIFMGDPLQQPSPAAATSTDSPVTTRQQFDALPSGAIYTGRNGKRFRKP